VKTSSLRWPARPVAVRVPATSANLGPGFDALGLALGLHDVVEARIIARGLSIEVSGAGQDAAAAGEAHLVIRAMRTAFAELGCQPPGIGLRCVNAIPQGYGLGSSAAAIVAGLLAARALAADSGETGVQPVSPAWARPGAAPGPAGSPSAGHACADPGAGRGPAGSPPAGHACADPGAGRGPAGSPSAGHACADPGAGRGPGVPTAAGRALLRLATRLEGHPDNAAACLAGGLTIAWMSASGAESASLVPVAGLAPVLCVPENPLPTAQARQVLPAVVPHADAAANSARAALLIAALTGDPGLLLAGTEDFLHQPYRAAAMPATTDLIRRLRAAGIAAVVSGAGPAVLALTMAGNDPGPQTVQPIADAAGAAWQVLALDVDRQGAAVETRPG